MKLEIKILFLLVGFFLLAQPVLLDAKVLRAGDSGYKDPFIALILSLILPGLGHIYAGESSKGLIYLLIYIGIFVVAGILLFSTLLGWGWWLGWLLGFAFAIWVALDSMQAAKRTNERGGRVSLLDQQAARALNPVY